MGNQCDCRSSVNDANYMALEKKRANFETNDDLLSNSCRRMHSSSFGDDDEEEGYTTAFTDHSDVISSNKRSAAAIEDMVYSADEDAENNSRYQFNSLENNNRHLKDGALIETTNKLKRSKLIHGFIE